MSFPCATTNYLYDGTKLAAEVDNAGNVLAKYTQSKGIDKPLAQLRSGTVSYYEQDGLGSVTSLSNSAGTVVETYAYDSYGKLTASTGTLVNPFQYTGREFDSETGIYYYRARYFDPSAGRFLSQDPIRFGGGANFYAYTRNNPVVRTDPFGYYSGSGVVGSIYLGPDGVWHNDGPPLPSDLPGGCSPEQWAVSPNACAGPQGADEPDPWMRPPNPPNPNKCDKGDQPPPPVPQPPNPIPPVELGSCSDAVGEFGAGVSATAIPAGLIALMVATDTEWLEGIEGVVNANHVSITLAPGLTLMGYGAIQTMQNCFGW